MSRKFDIVVACDLNLGIGMDGTLPWRLSGDMAYFKNLTCRVTEPGKSNAVIMGRKTWESIPMKFRPLKERLNVVVTTNPSLPVDQGVLSAPGLDQALKFADRPEIERVFVIGGSTIYALALKHESCDRIYLTQVNCRFACDTFLPEFHSGFIELADQESKLQQQDDIEFVFKVLIKRDGLAHKGNAASIAIT